MRGVEAERTAANGAGGWNVQTVQLIREGCRGSGSGGGTG